jgi:glycosyltransferase involved in cell wall biosynthesis
VKVFLLGYPGDVGGANTECLHTVKLWRQFGVDVTLVPTWTVNTKYKPILDSWGCTTLEAGKNGKELRNVPGLAGSVVVGFCNQFFSINGDLLRSLGCKLVNVPCMTYWDNLDQVFCKKHGVWDAIVYQSAWQRKLLEKGLSAHAYNSEKQGHLIRGAFLADDWNYQPAAHENGQPFVVGRMARGAKDKWSRQTWPTYQSISYPSKHVDLLGVSNDVMYRLGPLPQKPGFTVTLRQPGSIRVQDYLSKLHCLLPINGEAGENWPRAGLEAFACGVPVVAQGRWGWNEMILHGETGFLATDDQLAGCASVLAWDESLRLKIAARARERLLDELAKPEVIWQGWERIFQSLGA